ncbi:hypothetical protein WKT02_03710 [Erysipelotrichaceae bacterium HCN-30851]
MMSREKTLPSAKQMQHLHSTICSLIINKRNILVLIGVMLAFILCSYFL